MHDMSKRAIFLARTVAVALICVSLVVGIVLSARGAMHGVGLVLSAGVLAAAYARLVLRWHPSQPDAVESDDPST